MTCGLCRTWAAVVVCFAAAAGRQVPDRFGYEEQSPSSQRNAIDDSPEYYETPKIVTPVSYTYFSSNLRDALRAPVGIFTPPQTESEAARGSARVLSDNIRQQTYVDPYQEVSRTLPPVSRRTLRFPLNTVLPANSLSFDDKPYPGLLQAVNTFSDLTPSRKPNEGVLVTHNTVSLPATKEGVTTASRTRITNHGTHDASYPYREFTETTHNTQGDRGSLIERTQRVRIHQGLDGNPAESHALLKTEGGGKRYESEQGDAEEEDHHSEKGGKGEKGYKKDHKHHKEAKGHHDKEQDSASLEEKLKKEKKFHKDEEYFGEQRKTTKGGKGKKYGEGGKHKKGHTTHGEHNIIKKDEFIKNTKFYDENHGGGEHEEHGEIYGHHEEKKGRNEEGGNKESNYEKEEEVKKKSRDKGHEDENHKGRDSASGREEHFEREEEYEGKKGGHTSKKWGKSNH